jgi:ABC-type nitrate/sulfonate/bicarbonate transport system substrate-binding protein
VSRSHPVRHHLRLGLVALAVATLGLAACGDEGGSTDGTTADDGLRTFTVVLDWTPNTNHAGMYVALAEGWYEDAGLEVRFVEPGEAGSLQVLAAGRAQVAVSVQEELLPARAAGLPVRSVAAIIESNTSSLVSLASEGIEEPADLVGARYGGFGGQLEAALLAELMRCDGADPDGLELVDVGESDYRIGLERDQYDVVWIFDGWDGIRLSQVEGLETNAIRFADHTDCIPDWYTPLLATSEQVEADRGDDLAAFLDATAQGYRKAMADPAGAARALLAETDGLDPELVEASAAYLATRYASDPDAWGRQRAEVWIRFAAFLEAAGLLDEGLDVQAAWTNDHLPET